MSETRPLTAGDQLLTELTRTAGVLADTDNELLTAIAAVLRSFTDNYDTTQYTPRCQHRWGSCPGHDLQTFHGRCGATVQACPCLKPYLQLARQATA